MSNVPTLAGIASTVIFAWSVLPMLAKAHRTRDLASYSLGNLVLANVGNAVHSVYVFSLPIGPIWVLHGFYLASSWLMLIWCLRYRRVPRCSDEDQVPGVGLTRRTLAGLPQAPAKSGRVVP
jgi:uncharacterized membrane protein